jgi:hypothetical protein
MLRKVARKIKHVAFGKPPANISNDMESMLRNLKSISLQERPAAKVFDQSIKSVLSPHHRSLFWGDRMLTIDKSAGFLSDPQFREAYDAIRGSHEYDQYDSPFTIAWRLHTLIWAAKCGRRFC